MAYEPRGEHGGGGQDGTSMKARGRSKYLHSLPFIDNPVSCIRILDSFVRRAGVRRVTVGLEVIRRQVKNWALLKMGLGYQPWTGYIPVGSLYL